MSKNIDLLVIGSGISGLTAGLEAKKHFSNVLIIDKGFHTGGRICSKNLKNCYFNHGAPFINRSKIKKSFSFYNLLYQNNSISKTVIRDIHNKPQLVYYTNPTMRMFFEELKNKITIKQKVKALNIFRDGNFYVVICNDNNTIVSKKVILSVPAPQASDLIKDIEPKMSQDINKIKFSKCLTVLLSFDRKVILPTFSFFEDGTGDLSSLFYNINFNNNPNYSLVVRMSNKWSEFNFEYSNEQIINKCLLELFKKNAHLKNYNINKTYCHKWRYSQVLNSLAPSIATVNKNKSFGVAGDWTIGPTVEDAFISGEKVIKCLL
ncbi:MAG: FAD-dependent oxidoreductase [Paracoccaceae bacterium]